MTDITLTSAEKVVRFAYSMREDGFYCRPMDFELREEFGGKMVASGNDEASLIVEVTGAEPALSAERPR